jgi:CheY-like chemotaxis protein/nitrogen-specific signal transduction histidine kinase
MRFLWPTALVLVWVGILMVMWVSALRRSVRIRTAELAAAGAAKTEFLANVSHEIRSPISAVLGLVDLMEQDPLTDEQKEMIHHVRKAGRNLLRILNDVLDLSRIEARKLPLENQPFELNAELAHLDELYGNLARNQGLRWYVELPNQRLTLIGDATRFQQILGNLVSNAIKFTERGSVTVKAGILKETAQAVSILVEVTDTGSGIEPDALSRLFQPFTQIGSVTNRGRGGVGLGLSISRHIATLMGGRIHATSAPGQGSTFCVEIPFERATRGGDHPAGIVRATQSPRLVGFRILLVDDQPLNLRILQGMLRRVGARVVTRTCAREALQLLRSDVHAFDAVLMDLQMPGMNGLEAIRTIRKEPSMDGLCVLAMSAAVTPEHKDEALAAGADDFITRPIEIERLGTVLYRHVRGQEPITSQGEPADPITKQWLPEMPKIAGMDPRVTARTCGGDLAFLADLLLEFETEFGALAGEIRQDLAAGNTEQAASRLHSLRGVAAPMGAVSLASAAESLEIACRAPGQRFETFEFAMREFLEGIRAFNEAREQDGDSKPATHS